LDVETGIGEAAGLVEATGAKISGRACDYLLHDGISVPHRGSFANARAYCATVLHELAHWTGRRGDAAET